MLKPATRNLSKDWMSWFTTRKPIQKAVVFHLSWHKCIEHGGAGPWHRTSSNTSTWNPWNPENADLDWTWPSDLRTMFNVWRLSLTRCKHDLQRGWEFELAERFVDLWKNVEGTSRTRERGDGANPRPILRNQPLSTFIHLCVIYASSCVDEELRSARIGLTSVCHRQAPRWVAIIGDELVLRLGDLKEMLKRRHPSLTSIPSIHMIHCFHWVWVIKHHKTL